MANFENQTTLDEALAKCRISLRGKLLHAVELLQRAEKIALAYDPVDGFYLAFSGGKDSQALYHVAKLAGVRFKAHFSPTSVDPPEVIRFIHKEYPDVHFEKIKKSIFDLAVEKEILPSMRIRWCCKEFKEGAGAGRVTLIGIRNAESVRRSKRNEVEINSHKFSGTMDEFVEFRKKPRSKRGRKPKDAPNVPSVANLDGISSEHVTGCIRGRESLLVSPIIKWTEEDVWHFLNDVVGVSHCVLYDRGRTRIGCIFCPMSCLKVKLRDAQEYPHVVKKWIDAIIKIRDRGVCQRTNSAGTQFSGNAIQREYNEIRHTYIKLPNQYWGLLQEERLDGFSDSRRTGCGCGGSDEEERVIAANILEWWISGKNYRKWYAEKFQQQKIEFDE